MTRLNDFDKKTTEILAKRASYICSNPECRSATIAPSEVDEGKFIYVGEVAHIIAASSNGPRSKEAVSNDNKKDISNGIFLCSVCACMIDKNNGIDFSIDTLRQWKTNHEKWVRDNLNKKAVSVITEIDGQHNARGVGVITGLEIKKPAIIKPGTIVTAEGVGTVTGTKIG